MVAVQVIVGCVPQVGTRSTSSPRQTPFGRVWEMEGAKAQLGLRLSTRLPIRIGLQPVRDAYGCDIVRRLPAKKERPATGLSSFVQGGGDAGPNADITLEYIGVSRFGACVGFAQPLPNSSTFPKTAQMGCRRLMGDVTR